MPNEKGKLLNRTKLSQTKRNEKIDAKKWSETKKIEAKRKIIFFSFAKWSEKDAKRFLFRFQARKYVKEAKMGHPKWWASFLFNVTPLITFST